MYKYLKNGELIKFSVLLEKCFKITKQILALMPTVNHKNWMRLDHLIYWVNDIKFGALQMIND